jgi:PilZ domain-containing protein
VHSEQRKDVRFIFTRQPTGKLQVLLGDQCIDVSAVKDVSLMGMRLEVGTQVHIGENIRVRYVTEILDLTLNGIVVWNSSTADGSEEIAESNAYTIGIKLASPSLLQAFW